jgi:hypothetical protein
VSPWARTVDAPVERVARTVRRTDGDRPVAGPAHGRVGVVRPDRASPGRSALAAVARSLGHEAPAAAEIAALDAEIADTEPDAVDLATARERVAGAGSEVDRLRERVAALRGRVETLRGLDADAGADVTAAERAFREAARELSEAETERRAAEQALSGARERARTARDDRERRLELVDRRDNLAREARSWLATRVRDRVDAAVAAVPGSVATTFADAGPVTARLGAARVAGLRAPVVLACRRFPTPRRAARWLDTPVVRVRPTGSPPLAGRGRSSGR